MANQREQQQASQPRPPMPRYMSELYGGLRFDPNGRCLVRAYLTPKAIRGRLPADEVKDAIPDDVDVYGARPEALPFHRCNRSAGGKVWGHFFTTRPAAGGDVLYVPGGLWARYGEEKAYADAGGDVLGYRRRYAFHGGDGQLTAWRMKEFRLNAGAAAFRGVTFHPVAKDLVAWKVYNDVEEPLSDEEGGDEDEEDDDEAEDMEVDEPAAAAACTEDDSRQRQDKKKKQRLQ
ncbi:NAC transcription factor NAM-2-like [Hordeum vulgare subsp. vulgare]|uniref:NAC domain-containing protein n=1 Tax=Hordeum vulgare subsp. vulgare TaxID=112509 RepID=A0A8I6WTV7_HORVV|nr:NAC transcription factor NAM-2-like [Hordeum vulgare subsp. vulgare]KAI5014672.1 hypothetical protein ZWY2020_056062 [Hordeum vulgare]